MKESIDAYLTRLNQDLEERVVGNVSLVLNDPAYAKEFYAVWHTRKMVSELEKIIHS